MNSDECADRKNEAKKVGTKKQGVPLYEGAGLCVLLPVAICQLRPAEQIGGAALCRTRSNRSNRSNKARWTRCQGCFLARDRGAHPGPRLAFHFDAPPCTFFLSLSLHETRVTNLWREKRTLFFGSRPLSTVNRGERMNRASQAWMVPVNITWLYCGLDTTRATFFFFFGSVSARPQTESMEAQNRQEARSRQEDIHTL